MNHPVGTPCWVDLSTPDPQQARDFYTAVLGWAYDIQSEAYFGYSMARTNDGVVAGIGQPPSGSEAPSAWTIYLAVADVSAATRSWKEAGGQILVEPFEVPAKGHMAIATDPTGGVVGLWQPTEHHGFDVIGPPGSACWFELNSWKSEDARDFFVGQFGHTANRMEGMHYYVVNDRERPRFGVLQMTEEWEGLPPHWVVYFSVSDVDGATAAVKANGGEVKHGPFDSPQGRIAVCTDPANAVFMLIAPTS